MVKPRPSGRGNSLVNGKTIKNPMLALNNVYYGAVNSGFRLIVGFIDDVDRNYMMNPNNLVLQTSSETLSKESIIGLFLPEDNDKASFTLLNLRTSSKHISSSGDNTKLFLNALVEEYTTQLYLSDLLKRTGFNVVRKKR